MTAISEIWRYPVSSLGGEKLDSISLVSSGVAGDRAYLLVDAETGEVASPETSSKWRKALMMKSRYDQESVLVSSPHWSEVPLDKDLDGRVSEFMGFACRIVVAGSYVAGKRVEPRYSISPIHILTSGSIARLLTVAPALAINARRFRPNIVLDCVDDEQTWIGSGWACSSAAGKITEPTKRCGMTMIEQPDLPDEPEILRAIVRNHRRCLGVYASVGSAGAISVGDEFRLV